MDTLEERIDSYNLFAFIFLTLPDEKFINNILSLDLPDGMGEGISHLKYFIDKSRDADINELLAAISVDRTYLIRGLTQSGPRPPYESVYVNHAAHEIIGQLNVTYAEIGYSIAEGVHEPSDYIGVELSFMKELCVRELETSDENMRTLQKAFFEKHLGRWAQDLAREFITKAQTDLYRAIGYMLNDFINEERSNLS